MKWRSHLAHLALATLTAAASTGATAHEQGVRFPAGTLAWSFEPWVVSCLALAAALYLLGLVRLWRRAGAGRGVRALQLVAFWTGWAVLATALVSPLDSLGAQLFSAHMVQHELLMIIAAPLFVVGRPLGLWAWALPARWRRASGRLFHVRPVRSAWRFVTQPLVAWTLHALALWIWHLPALFDAALASEWVHALQHFSFLATALLFWWSVLGAANGTQQGIALLSLFTTMVHSGALGALLALSSVAWYPAYANSAPAFGLSALDDQQLGGLLMWVPAGLIYLCIGCALAARWLAAPRRRVALGTSDLRSEALRSRA
ncbi:MAG TPA: cytochrome c oxidase assembly protein [Burkholderiaceae bacterium]|nr:cytochrome c oxidase assembly protein [Burkholderiaceae bacterium]